MWICLSFDLAFPILMCNGIDSRFYHRSGCFETVMVITCFVSLIFSSCQKILGRDQQRPAFTGAKITFHVDQFNQYRYWNDEKQDQDEKQEEIALCDDLDIS